MKTLRNGGTLHSFLTSPLYYVTSDRLHAPAAITRPDLNIKCITNHFEVRHPRCVGSITKNFCVLHIQSNTTIFHLVVH